MTANRIASAALVALAMSATACASDGHIPGTRVFTVATAGDVVLAGFSRSHGSMGNFELASIQGDPMTCDGRFRYVTTSRGHARFQCSNGESGVARITAGTGLSGEGTGESSLGAVHIIYGLPLDEINARMHFPQDGVIRVDDEGIRLVPGSAR